MFGDSPVITGSSNLLRHVTDHGNSISAAGGAECCSRFGLAEFDGSSGQLWLSYFTPVYPGVVGRLMMSTGSVAAVGVTLTRLALFTVAADDSVTKVAQTASDTSVGAAIYTPYELGLSTAGGFPASYTLVPGVRYAFGFLQVADTACKVQGMFIADGATAPVPSRVVAGQTDISGSYPVGSLSPMFAIAYIRGRV